MPARRLLLVPAALLALPVVAACSSDQGSSSTGASGAAVTVTASDSACQLARTDLDAGSTSFQVKNTGSKVTEVYVYGQQGGQYTKVVSEVENIGPGTSRTMTVDLPAGTYEVACKPGQTGDGIRTKITVGGGTSGSSSAAAAYDRELELSTDGSSITGLDGATAKAGEKVELKLQNSADGKRTLEVKKPDGTVAGEVDVPAGQEGELVVELAPAGSWTVVLEGGSKDLEGTLTVS